MVEQWRAKKGLRARKVYIYTRLFFTYFRYYLVCFLYNCNEKTTCKCYSCFKSKLASEWLAAPSAYNYATSLAQDFN